MPRKNKGKPQYKQQSIAEKHLYEGLALVRKHPIFGPLAAYVYLDRASAACPQDGWAIVTTNGRIFVHPTRVGKPEEWCYVFAHCLLHLGFGHFQKQRASTWREWNAACDCFIAHFLSGLKLGSPPQELRGLLEDIAHTEGLSLRSEERLYEEFCTRGIPASLIPTGTAGKAASDMVDETSPWKHKTDWQKLFSEGLAQAVTQAVEVAGGHRPSTSPVYETEAHRARTWFINHYPLLGALAAAFTIIEDPLICHRMDIRVAAVNMEMKEIYINPGAGLSQEELRFVMAHELLHVGLRHDVRCAGRDPYFWNVACDYVINAWLMEMDVGDFPHVGGLYDEELKSESAEAIYDRIVTDLRRYRKLTTMRGVGLSDILDTSAARLTRTGTDLDDFYRSCLSQGLLLHQEQGRGYLSAGLIEEIRALSHPPIPWDVELARWFDRYFEPLEKTRTYARVSRRQSATPDIPRPRWIIQSESKDGRTFGVLLDTSGSMQRSLLAKALGAIASYSIARDIPAVRVVFCDSAAFDQGYMAPDAIADKVKVRGRGGTVLQPGLDLLEHAEDFPKQGPILIITDGFCDRLHTKREHAFLLPYHRSLPFVPRGPVFRMQ